MKTYTRDGVKKALTSARALKIETKHVALLGYMIAMNAELTSIHLESENRIGVIGVKEEQVMESIALALYEETAVDKDEVFVKLPTYVKEFFNWRVAVAKGLPAQTLRVYQGIEHDEFTGIGKYLLQSTVATFSTLDSLDDDLHQLFKELVGFEFAKARGEINE